MPRFAFRFNEGDRVVMDIGAADLHDLSEARERARTIVRDLMSVSDRDSPLAWDGWRVEVTDQAGQVVSIIPFATEAGLQ